MLEGVQVYPATVTAVNGSETGPYPPGPASSFTYTVDITTEDGNVTQAGIKPAEERWPDSFKVNPISPGTMVHVFKIGDVVVMGCRELPHTTSCPGTLSGPSDLLRQFYALAPKAQAALAAAILAAVPGGKAVT